MLFIKLLRYFFGYVGFETKGGFTERFINLCYRQKIPLWKISSRGGKIRAETTIRGYKKIREPSKKSAVRPKVVYKKGVPFLIHNNRFRIGLVAAGIAVFALFLLASRCIWRIEVSGNIRLSDARISEAAALAGVERGVFKKTLTQEVIEKSITDTCPEVMWASANIRGCTVVLEIRERTTAALPDESTTPANIVASRDGYIQLLNTYRGDTVVANYMAVTKGQLLISGIVTMRSGQTYPVRAMGECFARTNRKIAVRADIASYTLLSEQKERSLLYFFGLKLPIGKKTWDIKPITGEKDIGTDAFLLPVGVIKEHTFTRRSIGLLDDETVLQYLTAADFYEEYISVYENTQILESIIEENTADAYELICRLTCVEDIAETQEFEYENYMPDVSDDA